MLTAKENGTTTAICIKVNSISCHSNFINPQSTCGYSGVPHKLEGEQGVYQFFHHYKQLISWLLVGVLFSFATVSLLGILTCEVKCCWLIG